jgi:bifunctional enzyme CysN/CysC
MMDHINIVIVGHVDHGKSTIIGRLLADTGSLPNGKLEQVRASCERNSKPFEYAFLLDALKDEQSQGITIDAARVFFKTEKRKYIIIDAPGHIEFLKNMITGAARAEAALLVIDAAEGIQENSRRHGYMLSMLGIRQVSVLINKMDLVNNDKKVYEQIKHDYSEFLKSINITAESYIPVSGMVGDNIAGRSSDFSWYEGDTVIDQLDRFHNMESNESAAFRMPVQDVYKFTAMEDNRRIIAGNVETGSAKVGDKITFYPSGKTSHIKSIEGFNVEPQTELKNGFAVGFTLEEQIYITRGEIAVKADDTKINVSSRFQGSVFWLGKNPLVKDKRYILKLGSARVNVKLEQIIKVINSSNLEYDNEKIQIDRHEVAECIFKLEKPIAFDIAENFAVTSRFVVIDDYEIRGGGIITKSLDDQHTKLRNKVLLRNSKWIKSEINPIDRANRLNQKPAVLIVTGSNTEKRKEVARLTEKHLFEQGKFVYFLGIGSVLYGVDSDLESAENREEHIRRFAEVVNILLDSGLIVIVSANEMTARDLDYMKAIIDSDLIESIWVGSSITTDIRHDLFIEDNTDPKQAALILEQRLQDKGSIFKVW